jgi:hypothetical protein
VFWSQGVVGQLPNVPIAHPAGVESSMHQLSGGDGVLWAVQKLHVSAGARNTGGVWTSLT